MAATMLPEPSLLTPPATESAIMPTGRSRPTLRDELRRIPSARNAVSVASCYVQTLAVIVATCLLHRWWHGGVDHSNDRRITTHSVRQHALARTFLVPYWIGWHLAHHCDSGIPMRNVPRYHRELVASGYVAGELEYRSYPALWRKLSSRPA